MFGKFFIFNLIILFLLNITLNFFVDPYGIFRDENNNIYERKIAKDMTNNKSVFLKSVMKDDLIKYFLVKYDKSKTPIVVLGSSRGYKISSSIIGKNLKNYSIGAAGLEDRIAFLYLIKKQYDPKLVIVQIDPHNFSDSFNRIQPYFFSYYNEGLQNLGLKPSFKDRLRNIKRKAVYYVDSRTTLESFKILYTKLIGKDFYLENISDYNNGNYYELIFDGHIVSPDKFEKKSTNDTNRLVLEMLKGINPNDYTEQGYFFSHDKFDTFVKFINEVSKKSKVIILIPPYHPLIYKTIQTRTLNYFESEKLLNKENFNSNNIKIVGSFSPFDINCLDVDFYDYSHPKESCFKKMKIAEEVDDLIKK